MIVLNGIAPASVCRLLSGSHTAEVEMVNSRGIYLLVAGIRVLLCDSDTGVVPNGAAIANRQLLLPLLEQGQRIRIENCVLQTPTCHCMLQLQPVPEDKSVSLPSREDLRHIASLLRRRNAATGLAPLVHSQDLNPCCTLARPWVKALLQALADADIPKIQENTASLLGLGPGLTPSGDDVLSGLLYGLRHSSMRDSLACDTLTRCIQTLAPERTNGVSADYLLALSMDAPFGKMHDAWHDPVNNAGALLGVGSNSGSEMLLGLLLAGRVLGEI